MREHVGEKCPHGVFLTLSVDLQTTVPAPIAHRSGDRVARGNLQDGLAKADGLDATAERHDGPRHGWGYGWRMDPARFPPVSGAALDGTPFVAPRDLSAGRMVVLLGFALEHRADLESWVPFLDALARSRPDVRVRLFIPLSVPKIGRGAIVAALKAAVAAPEQRMSTIPLFVDVDAFTRSLGITDRSHLVILVVEPDGSIVWRGGGRYSEEAAAALSAALG